MPPRFSVSNLLVGPAGENFFRGFTLRTYSKGSLVGTGDGEENGIFVVMNGRLRMFLVGEEREISLFYLGPGDMFCLHSGCLIEATERSDLRVTDIHTFERKLAETPQLAWGLISILGRALTSFMRTIEDLMFHDIKQRIARFFVDHAQSEGRQTADGLMLEIQLTVEGIAKYLGSSRQATSTAMNSLIKEGYLSRQGRGAYAIPDLERLSMLARGELPADLADNIRPRSNAEPPSTG